MARFADTLAKLIYGLFAVGCLVLGAWVLLYGTGLLPASMKQALLAEAHGDLNTLHIVQEFASLLVFAGLISLWFVWHYEQSRVFHWALTAFWALIALVHWFDVRGPHESIGGPLIITVPLVVFLATGLLRAACDRPPGKST